MASVKIVPMLAQLAIILHAFQYMPSKHHPPPRCTATKTYFADKLHAGPRQSIYFSLCAVDLRLIPGSACMQTPIYLVVETSGSNVEHDFGKLETFLEEAYDDKIITDGTIAQDSSQQASIWNLRESISEGLRHAGIPVGWHALCCCLFTYAYQKRCMPQEILDAVIQHIGQVIPLAFYHE